MLKEWLKNTYKASNCAGIVIPEIRERITCNDGFSMSVQASYFHYCKPRINLPDGNYEAVEIGFPSEKEELIMEFAEDDKDPTDTVYGYVPIEIVEKVIEKHGGMKMEDKP